MTEYWFELTVTVPQEDAEAVGNFLVDSGAPGLQSDEHGTSTTLIAHFSDTPPVEALHRLCAALGCNSDAADFIRVQRITAENWAENWKLDFEPLIIGERLYVCPSWDAAPPPGREAIIIDPGMAFGTGHHATTRGCLVQLEWVLGRHTVTRAADIGTGSGLLAIALARLGVPEVWAVDTDAQACAIARDNAVRNHVDAAVHIRCNLDDAPGAFDLIVANLFAGLLEELAPRFAEMLRAGGIVICSGLLISDEARLARVYAAHGFDLERRDEDPPWMTIAWRRKTVT